MDVKSLTDKELVNNLFVWATRKVLLDELQSRAKTFDSVYDHLVASKPQAADLKQELLTFLADQKWNFVGMDDPEYAREFCEDPKVQESVYSELSPRQARMLNAIRSKFRQYKRGT